MWRVSLAGLLLALGVCTHVPSQDVADSQRIIRLIKQLGDEDFAKREAAGKELADIGELALPALRQAAASAKDLEVRARAGKIVREHETRALAAIAKKELAGLQGTWHSVATEMGSAPQTGVNRADKHLIQRDSWICEFNGTIAQTATLRIAGTKGKTILVDFVITDGFKKGDIWLGIYERSGDDLKWCGGYAGDNVSRPTSFATRAGDGYLLRVLKRDKK